MKGGISTQGQTLTFLTHLRINFVIHFTHLGWICISRIELWFTQMVLENTEFAEDNQDTTHMTVIPQLLGCFCFYKLMQ